MLSKDSKAISTDLANDSIAPDALSKLTLGSPPFKIYPFRTFSEVNC